MKKYKLSYSFFYIVTLFFLIQASATLGQSKRLESFGVSYLEENGVIFRETVYSLLEDSRGVLWIATDNGVWQYDGYEVKQFKGTQTETLFSSQIKKIIEDNNGNIWIATIGGGLSSYNWNKDKLVTIINEEDKKPLQSNDINVITLDKKSNLWIGYRWGGIDYLDVKSGDISTVIPKDSEINDVSEIKITSHFLFIGTWRSGVFKLNLNSFETSKISLGKEKIDTKTSPITSLYIDEADGLWVGNRSATLYHLDKNGELKQRFLCQQENVNIIPHINDIIRVEKHLYLITSTGVYLKEVDDNTPPILLEDNKLNQLLISATYDGFGNLWVGTSSGLLKLSPNLFELKGTQWSSDWNVTAIERNTDEAIFIGTWNNGLFVKEKDEHTLFSDITKVNQVPLDKNLQIYCLTDIKTGLLIGLKNHGLVYYDYKSKKVNKEWSTAVRNISVTKILKLDNEHLLIGSLEGLFLLDMSGKLITYLHQQNNKNTTNPNIQVTDIIKSKAGDIWVGTVLSGLFKITFRENFKENNSLNFVHSRNSHSSLSENYITSIYEDKRGDIWVGTRNNGVNKLITTEKGFKRYGIKNGLAKSRTVAFIEDSANKLWVLGESSISRYILDNESFIAYHQDNKDERINRFCCPEGNLIASYNQLVFGANHGLITFNPFKIIKKQSPKVFIKNFDFIVANKEEGRSYHNTENNNPIWGAKTLTLDYNIKSFSFELISSTLSDSKSIRYAYKLQGFDNDWNIVSSDRRFISYSNLPSGTYTFYYKVIDSEGVESEEASISIIQLTPFWFSSWAYFIYILLAVFVFFLVRKAVLYKISLEQKVKVERIIRSKENEVSQLRIKLFTDISHELRTPLTLVIGPLERLVSNSKYLGNDEVTDDLLTIQRNASKILEMIQNVMNVNRPENYKSSYHPTTNNIVPFVANLANQFVYLAEKQKIKFVFHSFNENFNLNFDKDKLDRVMTNLLSNAFKYAPNNESIIIEVFKKEPKFIPHQLLQEGERSTIEIGVFNSGSYIPKEEQQALFNRFYRGSEALEKQDGYGIGLSIVKELVEVQHGKVYHSSINNIGTYFGVSLPTFSDDKKSIEINEAPLKKLLFDPQKKSETIAEANDLPSLVIIEDDVDLLNFIKSIFTKYFNVHIFSNGQEGLNFIFDEIPDIVICDLMLPSKNGFEICEEIKKDIRTCHIPVIILTALGTREKELAGIEYGADAFIAKPFSTKYLLTKTRSILEIREKIYNKVPTDFILESKNNSKNNADKKFLDKLNQEIIDNISNSELKIEEMSQKFNLSRVHFFRKIKDITGMSPTEYKRTVRLKQASIKLLEGVENISQIAYSHGFSTPNYFSICFKKQFGVTPKQFIENNRLNRV